MLAAMEQRGSARWLGAGALVLTCLWCATLAGGFPAASAYRTAADEGSYANQAALVAHGGPGALSDLAARYAATPALHTAPPPTRVGHALVSALAYRVAPGVRTLSWLSLACHGLTALALLALGRGLWGPRVAASAALLYALSPLGSGAAQRALLDTHLTLALTVSVLCGTHYLAARRPGHGAAALVAFTHALLVKESAYALAPCLALITLGAPHTPWRRRSADAALVGLAAPLVALGLTALCVGGVSPLLAVLRAALGSNAVAPHAYLEAFGSGPWYEYVVDGLLLSPLTTLFALLGLVPVLQRAGPGRRASALSLTAYTLSLLAVLAVLPKNPRFALPVEPFVRLTAAVAVWLAAGALVRALPRLGTPRLRDGLAVGALVLLGSADARSFRHYFVEQGIYDPVAYNLLVASRFIPAPAPPRPPADPRAEALARARTESSPEAYLALSAIEYERKDFAAAEAASRLALTKRSGYAPAYNNLGLALLGQRRYAEAVTAFEVATRLDPAFTLARNNLAWARDEAAAHPEPPLDPWQ
jgi:tetratricopeptide (TPR) repeat protein